MPIDKVIERDNPRRYIRRIGDWAQEGGNNTILIMGTDRAKAGPATVDDGYGSQPGTGCIHMIAGRHDPAGNPDMSGDDAYVYLSRKTDVDGNLGLGSVVGSDSAIAAAVVKSDAVRVVGRKNIKIALDGGGSYVYIDGDQIDIKLGSSYVNIKSDKVTIDAGTIELGAGAADRIILGDTWMPIYNAHRHPTAVGPTGPVMPDGMMQDTHLSQRVAKVK